MGRFPTGNYKTSREDWDPRKNSPNAQKSSTFLRIGRKPNEHMSSQRDKLKMFRSENGNATFQIHFKTPANLPV